MRYAFLVLLIGTTACSQVPVAEKPKQETPRELPIAQNTPLTIDAKLDGDPAQPIFSGSTNLPSGTILNVIVSAGDKVRGEAQVQISRHKFTSGPLGSSGGLIPGKYDVELSSPLVEFQPPDVGAMLGRDYENLTGPYLREGKFGRTIFYQLEHVVPGVATARAKEALVKQDEANLRDFTDRTCIERQIKGGKATRTPRAMAEIKACSDKLVADVKRPD